MGDQQVSDPLAQVFFDADQVVQRINLPSWLPSQGNATLLQLVVLVQVISAEAKLGAATAEPGRIDPEQARRLASPDITERALRLAERILEPREAVLPVTHGNRNDVLVTTTGARVSDLAINRGWAGRTNSVDLAAFLTQRLRTAQRSCREAVGPDLQADAAQFLHDAIEITEGR